MATFLAENVFVCRTKYVFLQTMFLYSITYTVEAKIEEDWLNMMAKSIVPQIMATRLFNSFNMQQLLHPPPEKGQFTYNLQFTCDSLDQLNKYLNTHSDEIEAMLNQRYQNKVLAFRTILRRMN